MRVRIHFFLSVLATFLVFVFSLISFLMDFQVVGVLCIVLSIGIVCLGMSYFTKNPNLMPFGSTSVIFLFQFLLLFGCVDVFYIGGYELLDNMAWSVTIWLESDTIARSNSIHLLALTCYIMGSMLFSYGNRNKVIINETAISNNRIEERVFEKASILILAFVFLYFLFVIVTGRISITMTYGQYIERIDSFYQNIILFMGLGIIMLCSFGKGKKLVIGLALFSLPALVLILTGNKGDVLYPVLASIGILSVRSKKTPVKAIIFSVIVLIIVIPFVTSTRSVYGVLNGFKNFSFSPKTFLYGITEMGGQFRITTKLLSEFKNGSREFLLGFSYYNPIVNILDHLIPSSIRLVAPSSFNFSTNYAAEGFNQVAESYANFGVVGVILFFGLLGYLITKFEVKASSSASYLYYLGTISFVFINCLRNNFSFVFGQIIIIIIIHLILRAIMKKL